jgi:hypothetical protein
MVVPVPAAMTDAVVIDGLHAHADVCAKRTDMSANTNALAADARAGANRTYIGSATYLLCRDGAGGEKRSCKNGCHE